MRYTINGGTFCGTPFSYFVIFLAYLVCFSFKDIIYSTSAFSIRHDKKSSFRCYLLSISKIRAYAKKKRSTKKRPFVLANPECSSYKWCFVVFQLNDYIFPRVLYLLLRRPACDLLYILCVTYRINTVFDFFSFSYDT